MMRACDEAAGAFDSIVESGVTCTIFGEINALQR